MSLYLLIVKEAIQKQLFSCASFGKPNQVSCFAKSSGIAFAEFLWVQQFSTQKLLLELAEIPKSENCIFLDLLL
jgi:hypothetical protein